MRYIRILLLLLSVQVYAQIQVKEPIRFLALGDSYTIGESVNYNERWPSKLYDSLGNLGVDQDTLVYVAATGWTTSNLKYAIDNRSLTNDFNLVSLLIGVNNQYQRKSFSLYEKEFPELIELALSFVNNDTNQLFVVSIPDYAYTPFGRGNQNISIALDRYNQFANDYCDSLGITFYNITDISRKGLEQTNLVANDNLHPSAVQYEIWVDLIMATYSKSPLTSTKQKSHKSLRIFPNPVENTLFIEGEKTSYKIYNKFGVLVQQGTSNKAINVSRLLPGVYSIEMKNKNETFIKR